MAYGLIAVAVAMNGLAIDTGMEDPPVMVVGESTGSPIGSPSSIASWSDNPSSRTVVATASRIRVMETSLYAPSRRAPPCGGQARLPTDRDKR